MADFTFSPSPSPSTASASAGCSLFEKPVALTAASSSSLLPSSVGGALDDGVEDGCCICLEPFTVQDPTTVTSCRHEYHLQCILEWSQRSKECPICWQSFVLKDSASQQLLDAIRIERNYRSRNTSVMPTDLHHFHDSFGAEEDAFYSDDSDFDGRILQHLALAASRARYVRRRERQRSSGLGPQVFFSTSPENMPGTQHVYPISTDESQTLSHEVPQCDSMVSGIPLVNISPPSPLASSVNMGPSAASSEDETIKLSQPQLGTPHRPFSADSVSISESLKSKWSNASARYKESISKGTRGLKEKLLSRNNSVKELSKGVQRDMSAGVAKMIERLDISSKRPGASMPASGGTGRTLNFLFKGKGVQENVIARSLANNRVELTRGLNSEAPSHPSSIMFDKLEASLHQREQ